MENFGSPGHAERLAAPEVKARQIATLINGNVERRAADRKRDAALAQHRQQVEGGITIPTYQIPNQHVRIRPPSRCPFCTGSAFELRVPDNVLDVPHVSYRGSFDCLLCGRTVVKLEIGTRITAEQFRASGEPLLERGRPPKARVP